MPHTRTCAWKRSIAADRRGVRSRSPGGAANPDAAGHGRLHGASVDLGAFEARRRCTDGRLPWWAQRREHACTGTSRDDVLCGMGATRPDTLSWQMPATTTSTAAARQRDTLTGGSGGSLCSFFGQSHGNDATARDGVLAAQPPRWRSARTGSKRIPRRPARHLCGMGGNDASNGADHSRADPATTPRRRKLAPTLRRRRWHTLCAKDPTVTTRMARRDGYGLTPATSRRASSTPRPATQSANSERPPIPGIRPLSRERATACRHRHHRSRPNS